MLRLSPAVSQLSQVDSAIGIGDDFHNHICFVEHPGSASFPCQQCGPIVLSPRRPRSCTKISIQRLGHHPRKNVSPFFLLQNLHEPLVFLEVLTSGFQPREQLEESGGTEQPSKVRGDSGRSRSLAKVASLVHSRPCRHSCQDQHRCSSCRGPWLAAPTQDKLVESEDAVIESTMNSSMIRVDCP